MTARAREAGAVLLCLALTGCTPSEPADPASGPEQGRSSDAWTLPLPEKTGWAAFDEFTSGQTITPTGQGALYWDNRSAHGIAVEAGEFAWHTELPGFVCGASPVPNKEGQIAVLSEPGGSVHPGEQGVAVESAQLEQHPGLTVRQPTKLVADGKCVDAGVGPRFATAPPAQLTAIGHQFHPGGVEVFDQVHRQVGGQRPDLAAARQCPAPSSDPLRHRQIPPPPAPTPARPPAIASG